MRDKISSVEIGGKKIGKGFPILIIAEIGNNHDGKLSQAKRLIRDAYEAGADIIKFQMHIADEEMINDGTMPPHFREPRYQFVKRMQLNQGQHRILKQYTEKLGLIFLSSPFSEKAADLLDQIDVAAFKIGSGELTNLPFLRYVAKKKKPVILSTGMSTWKEIDDAVDAIRRYSNKLILIQCTSKYPCPYEDTGLMLIPALRKRYNCLVGLSDHTLTIYTAIASVVLGVCLIEKHFTIDKSLYGPDHKISLVKDEMRNLVDGVRATEKALSASSKDALINLTGVRQTFQKSIISKVAIPVGTKISRHMVCQKKPGTGISPALIDKVIGKTARLDINKNSIISLSQIK